MPNWSLGSATEEFLATTGDLGLFAVKAIKQAFRRPFEFGEIIQQLFEVGWRSSPLIAASGISVGIVMSLHTRSSMERFGAESMIPAVLALAAFKELGPLVVGLLVAGRVGAGIGAELAGMRVTEQIDALESLAIDSFKYLVVTRILACILALPILTVLMDFSILIGGFISEHAASHMSFRLFLIRSFDSVDWVDYIPPTIKTTVFGWIVGSVSCFLGYNAKQGAAGVGRASTQSVVWSSLLLILVDVLLVKITFFIFPEAAQ
jgi:phospholipid/cholesterol/gamma-HCH transport system permease protein